MKSNFCVCCGEEIPEGRQICVMCEKAKKRIGKLNLDYCKAAEADIRNLPYLKKGIRTLEKRRDFILAQRQGRETEKAPDLSDPYIPERKINEALNETLALAEISAEIVLTRQTIETVEATLQELPKDEREVLVMFYQKGKNASQIGEAMYFESEKTVYRIRNSGLFHYCLLYYGVTPEKK